MLKRISCLLGHHSVNRRRVWHNGIDFRTQCEECGDSLVRTDERGCHVLYSEEASDDRRLTKDEVVRQHA